MTKGFEVLDAAESTAERATVTEYGAIAQRWSVPDDATTAQYMRVVEMSGVLDFWDEPDEDVYTLDDGEPL
jgi:hypothetical protein